MKNKISIKIKQMDSLLLPIVIHSCDISTTKKLLTVCKSCFSDIDIWKFKFEYEFPEKSMLDFWSSFQNYRIQKTKMSILIQGGYKNPCVDQLLLEYQPIYQRLFKINYDLPYREGYQCPCFINV